MSDAPERIQIFPQYYCHSGCEWAVREHDIGDEIRHEATVYIRADIHAAEVERLSRALRPFSAAYYNDNGDVTISTGHITTADYRRAAKATK